MKVQNSDTRADTPPPSSDLTPIVSPIPSDQDELEEIDVRSKVSPESQLSFPILCVEFEPIPQSSPAFEHNKRPTVKERQNGNWINNSSWTPIATTSQFEPSRRKQPKPVKYKPWTKELQAEINKKLYPPKKIKKSNKREKKSN